MKKLLLALVFLTGCATLQLPITTIGFPKAAEQDVYEIISYLANHGYITEDMMEGYDITLGNFPVIFIETHKGFGILYGVEGLIQPEKKRMYIYVYQDCLAASSLIHEIFHIAGYTHQEKEIWNTVHNLTIQATKDLCGPDYQIQSPPEPTQEQIMNAIPLPADVDMEVPEEIMNKLMKSQEF